MTSRKGRVLAGSGELVTLVDHDAQAGPHAPGDVCDLPGEGGFGPEVTALPGLLQAGQVGIEQAAVLGGLLKLGHGPAAGEVVGEVGGQGSKVT